jgi:hypothetical protein
VSALHGLLAEFDGADGVVAAAQRARADGYRCMDAYTPFPVEGLPEALALPRTRMSLIVLIGGIVGGVSGYFMQDYAMAVSYPLNSGNRPLHSWPAFIPVTFELTILGAALAAVIGLFFLSGLPMPYHPVFNVPQFEAASRTGFFLCIEARDPKFEVEATRAFLAGLSPKGVYDVAP